MRSIIMKLVLGTTVLLPMSNGVSAMSVRPSARPVRGSEADPCTFFSKAVRAAQAGAAELESAFGWPYGPPKRGTTTITGPHCMFYSQNTGTISVRFGAPGNRAQFDSLPAALGTSAERVNGIGESAFFYAGSLFVFNKGRQFIVGVSGEMTPRVRAALLKLGRLGAPRLGA